MYRFDHTVENARVRGVNLNYGSECFAQIVLSLEDLARMVERGIYELSTWVAGMKFLPPPREVPQCFQALGFTETPSSADDVRARYREMAKQFHPDAGGTDTEFRALTEASEQAIAFFGQTRKENLS